LRSFIKEKNDYLKIDEKEEENDKNKNNNINNLNQYIFEMEKDIDDDRFSSLVDYFERKYYYN
jgi:hypothetical protein